MKRVVIFEGIASSGKTTLEKMLLEELARRGSVAIIREEETLMPLFENRDPEKAVEHLWPFVDRIVSSPEDIVIVDRLFITHAFRTRSSLEIFRSLEDKLLAQRVCLTILLTLEESAIRGRIEETIVHRAGRWSPGGNGDFEERIQYYIGQQRTLQGLANDSHIPVVRLDTTDKDWPRLCKEILAAVAAPR